MATIAITTIPLQAVILRTDNDTFAGDNRFGLCFASGGGGGGATGATDNAGGVSGHIRTAKYVAVIADADFLTLLGNPSGVEFELAFSIPGDCFAEAGTAKG